MSEILGSTLLDDLWHLSHRTSREGYLGDFESHSWWIPIRAGVFVYALKYTVLLSRLWLFFELQLTPNMRLGSMRECVEATCPQADGTYRVFLSA